MPFAYEEQQSQQQVVAYHIKIVSSILPKDLYLVINEKRYKLIEDLSFDHVYSGNIELKQHSKEEVIRIAVAGTSLHNHEYISGEIGLLFGGEDVGNYAFHALIKNHIFSTLIGEITAGKLTRYNKDIGNEEDLTEGPVRTSADNESGRNEDAVDEYTYPDTAPTRSGSVAAEDIDAADTFRSHPAKPAYVDRNIGRGQTSALAPPPVNRKADPGGEVTVFYGTNRNRTGDTTTGNFYGGELGDLEQGLCVISIPPGHKQGALERPGKILWWQRSENPAKHIVLQSITPLTNTAYYNYLKEGISKTDNKAALIFVHGFNTSFDEAAWRCGQIAYDIPFPGITGFFSWPSTGKTPDYLRDVERADTSVSCLTEFIENLVVHTEVKELHFIAHSMGNRVLTRALNQLVQKESFKNSIASIAQVIMAAPDIDVDVFNNEIYPVFKNIGRRRTLYASDKDIALFFSKELRRGLKRVGSAGENIYVVDGIDTIDASNVASEGIHHSYIFEQEALLYDLNMLLLNNTAPKDRRLNEQVKKEKEQSLKYWFFRK